MAYEGRVTTTLSAYRQTLVMTNKAKYACYSEGLKRP